MDHNIILGGWVKLKCNIFLKKAESYLLESFDVFKETSNSFRNLGVCWVKKIVDYI
jgi:hypothetical protein